MQTHLDRMKSLLAERVAQIQRSPEEYPGQMRKLIAQPFLIQAQRPAKQNQLSIMLLPENELPHEDRINVLALSVALGDSETFAQLLEHVTPEDLNSDRLTVEGFRQPYTLYHIALDPNGIKSFNKEGENEMNPGLIDGYEFDAAEDAPEPEAVIDELCKIIRLLAAEGANPNYVVLESEGYHLPPILCGEIRGDGYIKFSQKKHLQAELVLAGADLAPLVAKDDRGPIVYQLAHQFHKDRTVLITCINYLKTLFRKKNSSSSSATTLPGTAKSILDSPYALHLLIIQTLITELTLKVAKPPLLDLHTTTLAEFDRIDAQTQENRTAPNFGTLRLFGNAGHPGPAGETPSNSDTPGSQMTP